MSIGDTLAEARREGGLTVSQVSEQTRIRETIIKAIEQGDFSACGGDFYARGHIRSIAGVVGTDPVPLIREYDDEHGPPGNMRAAEIFEPATPIKIHEPRRFGFGKLMALALLAVIGYGAYYFVSTHHNHSSANQASLQRPVTTPTHAATPAAKPTTTAPVGPPESVIKLTAVQDCWVGLKDANGKYVYEHIVKAGKTMTWREQHPVSMVLGNPMGIKLSVNGKDEKTNTVQVLTLTIRPSGQNPVSIG